MKERDKEYYNKKIGELYAVIENQEKIIRDLQEKINTYENPEDLTLFYMWIDSKAKDKIKELQQEKDTLYSALIATRTKYNNDKARYRRKAKRYKQIIDRAIEYVEPLLTDREDKFYIICSYNKMVLLEILNCRNRKI